MGFMDLMLRKGSLWKKENYEVTHTERKNKI